MTKVNVLRVSFKEKHVQSSCCRQNKAWQVGRFIKSLVGSECKESERENVQRSLEEGWGEPEHTWPYRFCGGICFYPKSHG